MASAFSRSFQLLVSFIGCGANLICSVFSYTPISDPDSKGYFDLLIKVCCQLSITQFSSVFFFFCFHF